MSLHASGTTPDPDDWDYHWDAHGAVSQTNPANRYRMQLLLKLLGRPVAHSTVLDIGAGQGEFAIHLGELYPDLDVWGVEYSATGVQRARQAASAKGVKAHFIQRDLLAPVDLAPDQPRATYAVCSEVLEHVDDPAALLRHSLALLEPGARVVVTVPGGPRSAFDRHIGHRRHFRAALLHQVLTDAGLQVEQVLRTGFPFFNLYKLAVFARGRRLITDAETRVPGAPASTAEKVATRFFDQAFKFNLLRSPFGWQLAAVATVPPRTS